MISCNMSMSSKMSQLNQSIVHTQRSNASGNSLVFDQGNPYDSKKIRSQIDTTKPMSRSSSASFRAAPPFSNTDSQWRWKFLCSSGRSHINLRNDGGSSSTGPMVACSKQLLEAGNGNTNRFPAERHRRSSAAHSVVSSQNPMSQLPHKPSELYGRGFF